MKEHKVALVTAAGSGMGAAIARKLADDGFKVAILSSSGRGEALAGELGGVGVTGSNQNPEDLQRLVDTASDAKQAMFAVSPLPLFSSIAFRQFFWPCVPIDIFVRRWARTPWLRMFHRVTLNWSRLKWEIKLVSVRIVCVKLRHA